MMGETYECLTGEPSLLKGRRLVREGGAGNVLALTSDALASYLTEKSRKVTRWLSTLLLFFGCGSARPSWRVMRGR
jgi:hypothetical protein